MADGAAAPAEPGDPPYDQAWDNKVWDDHAASAAEATVPWLHLDGFDGPLDLLVDLAHRQRIDLGCLSIVGLAEQFVGELEGRLRTSPIERRADWLVLAAQLLQLRSRVLFPATPAAAGQGQRDAAQTLAHLEAMSLARAAAHWLDGRPQLGRDMFARPQSSPRGASLMALMEACLTVLRGADGDPADEAAAYRIDVPKFWRAADARAYIRLRLDADPQGGDLAAFVPQLTEAPDRPVADPQGGDLAAFVPQLTEAPDRPVADRTLHVRAAVASTFVACLELARNSELQLQQTCDQSQIGVRWSATEYPPPAL